MDSELLKILVCPVCRGALEYDRDNARLICRADRLAFAVTEDGIPVLLAEEAKPLEESE